MTAQSSNLADRPAAAGGRSTSYDVARLAGVSQSAVSRAFREGGSVSESTRLKVQTAARQLGYAPNNIARSLITRRSRMLGVLVTETTTRNYPEILFHLGQEIQAAGSRMLVFTLPSDEDSASVLGDLLAYHVDGVVAGASMSGDMLEVCQRHRLPVVLYNRVPRGPSTSAVGCDHATGMKDLCAHLFAGGMRRASFLAGPGSAPVSMDRQAAAAAALAGHGLELSRIVHADYSYEGGRAAAALLLAGSTRPDTIICANDSMALGVIDACRYDLGLRVPGDVAVTGFDDIPQAGWPSYSLTTLRQPVRDMTRAAVRMVLEHIAGEAIAMERRLMPAGLAIRGSTRAMTL